MKKISLIPTEHEEQVAFLQWFEMQFPGVRIFSIPNGTRSSIRAAIKAKKEGVKRGIPDLFCPKFRIWIEMKRVKGSTVSSDQKDWHNYLEKECGDTVIIGRGWVDASQKVLEVIRRKNL